MLNRRLSAFWCEKEGERFNFKGSLNNLTIAYKLSLRWFVFFMFERLDKLEENQKTLKNLCRLMLRVRSLRRNVYFSPTVPHYSTTRICVEIPPLSASSGTFLLPRDVSTFIIKTICSRSARQSAHTLNKYRWREFNLMSLQCFCSFSAFSFECIGSRKTPGVFAIAPIKENYEDKINLLAF